MNIELNIEYLANAGEVLCVAVSEWENDEEEIIVLPMKDNGNGHWNISFQYEKRRPLTYKYILKSGETVLRREWGRGRAIVPGDSPESVISYDSWLDMPSDSYAYSVPFAILFGRQYMGNATAENTVTFRVCAPMLPHESTIALTGDFLYDKWSVKEALELKPLDYPFWEISVPRETFKSRIEYKYIVIDSETGKLKEWEGGTNRSITLPDKGFTGACIISDDKLHVAPELWRGAGVVIPLFSLRSQNSWGIGDISDLKLMVDWAASAGMRVIQLLPVNDTTNGRSWYDSYPYSANTSFALHPAYLDVLKAGSLRNIDKMQTYLDEAKKLNALPELDYEKVVRLKESYLRELYAESRMKFMDNTYFKDFMRISKEWLMPYAAYSYLRDKYGTSDFSQWEEYSAYDYDAVSALWKDMESESAKEIYFYCFVQYHLFMQFSEAREYAHSSGIMFKGDIPIGVNRNSADVWQNPDLFDCGLQAGAPPDDFAKDGQNWGCPIYKWDIMRRDGYSWWKARLKCMSRYFDAYRIDHILGFFRIWAIPSEARSGLLGHFVPAMPLTIEEMERTGFYFDAEQYLQPYITDEILEEEFGSSADEIKERYFTKTADGIRYSFKDEYRTQAMLERNLPYDDEKTEDKSVREVLMKLHTEVLFIEDPDKTGSYHPRIAAQNGRTYKTLDSSQRQAFDRLYEDFYFHRHNDFWRKEAMRKLPALISATDMLVCGEDLGMIPASVPDVMRTLNILSLEVERMPKEAWTQIADISKYPYLSVCATSTHDMSGIRLWWGENKETTAYYYNKILKGKGHYPAEATPKICKEILERNFSSPSMLAIFPLQDLLASDASLRRRNASEERINDPSNKNNYWCYRMHLTIEELIENGEFASVMMTMIKESGRF